MKCPKCKAKVNKNLPVCPKCDYELTPKDIKKSKTKRRLIIWIPVGIVLAVILLFTFLILLPVPYVESVTITEKDIQYNDSMEVDVSCYNNGGLRTRYTVPVYIDDTLVETLEFLIYGFSGATQTLTYDSDILPDSGSHILTLEDTDVSFNILDPAEFDVDFASEADVFAVGSEYQIQTNIKNIGESWGEFVYEAIFNNNVLEKGELILEAGDSKTSILTVSSDVAGTFDISINEFSAPLTFYESSRPDNGTHLMKNTVKGYSRIEMLNNFGGDLVAYLVKADDLTTAVVARYIREGEKHNLNSIVHGEYYLILQIGNTWLPEVNRFAENEKIYISWPIEFNNAVYSGAGSYEYYDLTDFTKADLPAYFSRVGEIPTIPEQ